MRVFDVNGSRKAVRNKDVCHYFSVRQIYLCRYLPGPFQPVLVDAESMHGMILISQIFVPLPSRVWTPQVNNPRYSLQ